MASRRGKHGEADGARGEHAGLHSLDIGLVRLGQVGGHAEDLDAVVGQPAGDRAAIKAAGSSEGHGFASEIMHGHVKALRKERAFPTWVASREERPGPGLERRQLADPPD